MDKTPLCRCHGEAMLWTYQSNRSNGGEWRCAVKRRASQLAYYNRRMDESFVFRATEGLRKRRQKALVRLEERHARMVENRMTGEW